MEVIQNKNPMQSAPHKNKGLWVLLLVVVLVILIAYILVSRPHTVTQTDQNAISLQLSPAEKKAIASQFTAVPTVSAKEKKDIISSVSSSPSSPLTPTQKKDLLSEFTQ